MALSLLATLLAVGCEKDPAIISDSDKSPIELSVGGVDAPAMTRAIVTDGTGKTLNAFDVNTKIFMVMKSEYDTDKPDFAGDRTTEYNVARGDVLVSENANNRSVVKFNSKNQRYWDDAHARSSMLSVYAYAQKGQTRTDIKFNGESFSTEGADQPFAWRTSPEIVPTINTWAASNQGSGAQTENTVLAQDLLFSNNLANYDTDGTDPSKDKRLKFNFSTRKFPQVGEANMIFYHAMSKITIKIIEGEGFKKPEATASDFKFTTTGGNIILKQFNHTGKFDLKLGEFTEIASNGKTDIPSIYLKSTNSNATGTDPHYVLEALVVPSIAKDGMSRFVDERKSLSDDVMLEFAVDNNLYQVTHDDLYEALKDKANATMMTDNGNYIPLEAGKNYVFTFTVGKTKIKNITAQVAEWEEVEAENVTPSNARIKLQVEERGTAQTSGVAFYKAEDNKATDGIDDDYTVYNWKTGYTNMNATYSEDHWTTSLFWQSNKDFYHFRALMPYATSVSTDGSGDGDYVTLTSAASYTDVRWGAPMKDDGDNETEGSFKWYYGPETNGFDGLDSKNTNDHQIYKAIGPTEDPVKLILFHMMSELKFTLSTTTGTDKVNFGDGSDDAHSTKIELTDFNSGGKLLLGNGLVTATGTAGTSTVSTSLKTGSLTCTYGAVPQDLTNVVLVITTPDNNQYKVKMKDVLATSVTNNNIANPYTKDGTKWKIDRWYPGFKYNYSFTLKKTGITNLEATVVDWETVTAGDDDVTIE